VEAALSETTPGQVIQVPNTLRLKVGGRLGGIDPAAIAKAEAALKSLSGNFSQWMNDELEKLEASRARIRTEGLNPDSCENLYLRAHDLKGLGTTYEFPIVSRFAASLCKLIDDPATRCNAPLFLIDAHIDAIKAAVATGIKTPEHPTGKAMVDELERRVAEFNGI
jgi:hypothetical protein